MGSVIFLFISLSFGQMYFSEIREELLALEKELIQPKKNIEKFNRINGLAESECSRELSQLTGTKIGKEANCQQRLWKASFRFMHFAQMESLSEKLEHKMSSLPIQKINGKTNEDLLNEVRELKELWRRVFGDKKI